MQWGYGPTAQMTEVGVVLPHIVWDWNGTLLDDLGLVVRATNKSLEGFTDKRFSVGTYRGMFRRPVRAFHEQFIGRQFSDVEWADIDVLYHAAYSALEGQTRLAPGAADALALGEQQGLSQSLLSMSEQSRLIDQVARHGLKDYFTVTQGKCEPWEDHSKVEALAGHLDWIGVDGEKAVVIGDTVDDALSARTVGAACVLVTQSAFQLERELALAAPVVSTPLEALTKYVCREP